MAATRGDALNAGKKRNAGQKRRFRPESAQRTRFPPPGLCRLVHARRAGAVGRRRARLRRRRWAKENDPLRMAVSALWKPRRYSLKEARLALALQNPLARMARDRDGAAET